MDRAWADDHQKTVITLLNDLNCLVTTRTDQFSYMLGLDSYVVSFLSFPVERRFDGYDYDSPQGSQSEETGEEAKRHNQGLDYRRQQFYRKCNERPRAYRECPR